MTDARHRKPTDTTSTMKKIALATVVGTGAIAVPATFAGPAQAADQAKWDCIANAESGGDWAIPYGDADSTGGLQIQDRTWADFGGTAIAPHAYQASEAQQIAVAEKILAAQGAGAWATAGQCVGVGSWTGTTGASTAPAQSGNSSVSNAAVTTTGVPSGPGITARAAQAIAWAKQYADGGTKARTLSYVFGAEGPNAYDCSSFLQAAWAAAGVNIPRDTESMRLGLTHVSLSAVRPGDLVLWHFSGTSQDGDVSNHVSMYIGGGQTIEMHTRTPNNVTIDSLATREQQGTVVGVVRPAPSDVAPVTPSTPPSPPKPAPTPAPTPAGSTYTVVRGDYLYKIAKAHYGDPLRWRDIYNANKSVIGSDPNLILPGQHLVLPK